MSRSFISLIVYVVSLLNLVQLDIDKYVAAERRIRELEDAYKKERIVNLTLRQSKPASPTFRPPQPPLSQAAFFHKMLLELKANGPSSNMQMFCAAVLKKCADPLSGKGSLIRKRGQRKVKFELINGYSLRSLRFRSDSTKLSKSKWLYEHACLLEKHINKMTSTDVTGEAVLRMVAKRFGLICMKKSDLQLDKHQALALRDHMKTSSNTMCRLKQALKTFLPSLKMLPLQLKKTLREVERDGVVPSKLTTITNCVITKSGNK